jgi:hypothetical protein
MIVAIFYVGNNTVLDYMQRVGLHFEKKIIKIFIKLVLELKKRLLRNKDERWVFLSIINQN